MHLTCIELLNLRRESIWGKFVRTTRAIFRPLQCQITAHQLFIRMSQHLDIECWKPLPTLRTSFRGFFYENCNWYYHHQWWFTTLTLTRTCTRTVFVVMALSFHSTIEGLALALEDEASGVWLNTGLLKFWLSLDFGFIWWIFRRNCSSQICHFLLRWNGAGLQQGCSFVLLLNLYIHDLSVCVWSRIIKMIIKVSLLMYCISIVVFSLAPALGSTVGIILTEVPLYIDIDNIEGFNCQIVLGWSEN